MANLDGSGLSEVWVRAAQLVKKYTGAVDSAKGDLQTQVNEKLSGTDDTKDNTVTFTSADELNPTAWKDVNVLSSKEKHLSLLNKISTMFSNVRYLYNILGTTDISALGTVTQAIATLNGNVGSIKGISSSAAITTQGQYALDAWEKNASINGTLANELSKVNSNLQIGEELDNSTIVLPNDVTLNSAYIKKMGSLVIGKISIKFTPDGTYKTVATLPSKFRPKVSYATHAVCGDYATLFDMSAFPTFILDVYQGGMIQMFAPSSNTAYSFAICFAYLA